MFGFRKHKKENHQLVLKEKQQYILVLAKIDQILIDTDNAAQASVIQELTRLLQANEIVNFTKLLNGVAMWGGSGAVWEIDIPDKIRANEFENEMLNLIKLMEQTQIIGNGIKPIKRLFEQNIGHKSK